MFKKLLKIFVVFTFLPISPSGSIGRTLRMVLRRHPHIEVDMSELLGKQVLDFKHQYSELDIREFLKAYRDYNAGKRRSLVSVSFLEIVERERRAMELTNFAQVLQLVKKNRSSR